MDLKKGTLINDRYLVEKLLGEGGMGSVYKVRDFVENRTSALKLIKEKIFSNKAIDRFKNEFKLVINLSHRNIIEVYDFDVYKKIDTYFITMEYIQGDNLNRSFYDMSNSNKYDILMQISRGLNYIHSRRIVHFDIKPDNIILIRNEEKDSYQVKIMDFGLASLLEEFTGKVRGTLSYIAPEVMLKKDVDYRADLYSLGMVIYHLFSNKLPFEEYTSIKAIVKAKLDEAFIVEDEFKYLENEFLKNLIIDLCRAKKEDRISNAQQLMNYLETASELDIKSENEKQISDNFNDSYYFDNFGYIKKIQDDYVNFCIRGEKKSGKLNLIVGEVGSGKTLFLKNFNIKAQLNRVPILFISINEEQNTTINIFYRKIIFGLLAYLEDDREKSDLIFSKAIKLIDKNSGAFIEDKTLLFNIKEVLRLVFSNLSKNLSPIILIDNIYNFKDSDNSLFLYLLHLIVKSPIFLVVSVKDEKYNRELIKTYEEIFYLFPSEKFIINRLKKDEVLEYIAALLNVNKKKIDPKLIDEVMKESSGNISLIKNQIQFLINKNYLLLENDFYKYNYFSKDKYTANIYDIYIARLNSLGEKERDILIFINEGLYSGTENDLFGNIIEDKEKLNKALENLTSLNLIDFNRNLKYKKYFIKNKSIHLLIKKVFNTTNKTHFYDKLSDFFLSVTDSKKKSIIKYTYCQIRSSAKIEDKIKVIELGISYCRKTFKEIYLRKFLEYYLNNFELSETKKIKVLKELYLLLIWDKKQNEAIEYYNKTIKLIENKIIESGSLQKKQLNNEISSVYSDCAYFNSSLISTQKRVKYLKKTLSFYSKDLANKSYDFIQNVNKIVIIYFRSGEIEQCSLVIDVLLEKYKKELTEEIIHKLNAIKWFFNYASKIKESEIYEKLVGIFQSLELDNIIPGEDDIAVVITLLNQIVLKKTHFPIKTAEIYIQFSDMKTDKVSEIALYYIYTKFLEKYGKLEKSIKIYNKLEQIIEGYKGIFGILSIVIDRINILAKMKIDKKLIDQNFDKAFSIANRLNNNRSLLQLQTLKINYLLSKGEFREVEISIKSTLKYISDIKFFRAVRNFIFESTFYFYTIKDSESFYEYIDNITSLISSVSNNKTNNDIKLLNKDINSLKALFTLPNAENIEMIVSVINETSYNDIKYILLIKYINNSWGSYKLVNTDFILPVISELIIYYNNNPLIQSYLRSIEYLLKEDYKKSYNEVFKLVKDNFSNGYIFDCYYPILTSLLYFKNISLYKNALYYEEKIEKLIKKLQAQLPYEKRYNFVNKYNIY